MQLLVKFITAHPWIVLALFALVTLVLGWQIRHFEVNASADTLLTQDNAHYIRTRVVNERFSPQEFLLVAYQPDDNALFTRQTYDDLQALKTRLLSLDRVESVRSLLDVPLIQLMPEGFQSDSPEEWTIENQDFSAARLRDVLQDHPIFQELLVNEELSATALQVLFRPNEQLETIQRRITELQAASLERELTADEQERLETLQAQAAPLEKSLTRTRNREIEEIRELMEPFQDRAAIYLGGVHVLGYQLIEIIQNDLFLFGSIIAAMTAVVLLLLFRSFRWVLLPLLACAICVVLTMGLFGLLGLETTVISSNFIALQLILTLAIVVHLIVQYRELCNSEPDMEQRALVQNTVLEKTPPSFYAGLTTSIGFASLLFTDLQPVISFGWMMMIAMFISITVSLLFFPALMMLFKREPYKRHSALAEGFLRLLHKFTGKHPVATLLLCLGAFVLALAGMPRLDVENSFINYFSEDTRVYRELSFIDRELGGTTPLDVVIDVPESELPNEDLVASAEQIQSLERVQALLREQYGMGKVLSVVNFTELARLVNDGRPLTEYELTALYTTLDDNLRRGVVGAFFSEDNRQVRISARVQDSTGNLDRAELVEAIRGGIAALGYEENEYTLTNLFVLYQDILQRLFQSQAVSLGIVYALLGLCFLLIFRSWRIGLIALTPNILATAGVLGVMGWLNIPLDLMTITIASIAVGIAVDDTIHYIHRFQRERRSPDGPESPVQRATFTVGFAMLYTSLIIMLGFSQLGFSDFIPSVQFGLLASLAMFMALISNLLLLPVLLARLRDKG